MSTAITIGDVLERLKTEYFSNPSSEFEKLCRKRELGIKQYIDISAQIIHQLIDYRVNFEGKLSYWKNHRIEQNIKNLCEYTELLTIELDKGRIEGHCKHKDQFLFSVFDPDLIFLLYNSLHGSILSDIMWAGDITVHEAMELSAGKLNLVLS